MTIVLAALCVGLFILLIGALVCLWLLFKFVDRGMEPVMQGSFLPTLLTAMAEKKPFGRRGGTYVYVVSERDGYIVINDRLAHLRGNHAPGFRAVDLIGTDWEVKANEPG